MESIPPYDFLWKAALLLTANSKVFDSKKEWGDTMSTLDWLGKFIFSHTRMDEPDSRPLYAYKCRGKDYDQLKSMVRALFGSFQTGQNRWSHRHEALLCLFAAETWRRYHSGGAWKWETVFNAIDQEVPDYNWMCRTIERGLKWWKRPLLHSTNGHREFLITIACEGGLPLRLLQKENAHLNRYFRQLLNSYHIESQSPSFQGQALARSLACHLPRSLHHDIVFTLSADLIQKVIALQERVPEALDPIAALNQQDENWRHELPLPVEDDTIELLLKNLVTEARTLAISARQKIRWRTFFLHDGDGWKIEQRLELPNTIFGAVLQEWTGQKQLSTRLRLLLHQDDSVEPIALITRLRGEGGDALFRCEVLPRNGVRLAGQAALSGTRLFLSTGSTEYLLHGQGSTELGPLPWVFRSDENQAEFLGEGSMRCREDKVLVVLPQGGSFDGADGVFELVDDVPDLKRVVYVITGAVEWRHPEFGLCRFQCSISEANNEVLSLEGRRLAGVANDLPPFLGMPGLFATNHDGGRRRFEGDILEWLMLAATEVGWLRAGQNCAGEVWIRYTDAAGCQRLRRKVTVIPSTARVEITRVGSELDEAGTICLSGLPGIQVRCTEVPGCWFDIRSMNDGAEIDCFAPPGLPITQFHVALSWNDGRSLSLQMPFPRQGAAFMRAGRVVQLGERVAMSRLASIHAIVQAPVGIRRFDLNVRIKSCVGSSCNLAFNESISLDSSGRGYFDLHQIQDRILSLLSLTGDLDDIIELMISEQEGQPLAQIEVGLFDLQLEPDYANNKMSLPLSALDRADFDGGKRVVIRMVRMWAPSSEPVLLERSGGVVDWTIPEGLDPGPWLVLGEDGDWPRFRPMLWTIAGEPEANESAMSHAIREADPLIRRSRLHDLVEQLASQSNHADWSGFWSHLRLTRRYPARAFDFFEHMAYSPEALVLSLIKSTDEDFDAVWSLAHQLPFSWHLLSVASWRKAGWHHFESLQEQLANIDSTGDMAWGVFQDFRVRVTNRQPFLRQICDWLAPAIFPDRPLENSELDLARNAPQFITGYIAEEEQNLQARHDSEERYPKGEHVMEFRHRSGFPTEYRYKHRAKPFRPILSAPFVAAHIALQGIRYDEPLLFELQQLRHFDKEWFDCAFALALCLGLAKKTIIGVPRRPQRVIIR